VYILLLLFPAFLKHVDFYEAHWPEKSATCSDWPAIQCIVISPEMSRPLTIFGTSAPKAVMTGTTLLI